MAVEEDQRRWNRGRAAESSRPLIIKPHLPPSSQGNCFLRFIVLFRLTGAMISLLVLYSSRLYRAIMAAYLLYLSFLLFSHFPLFFSDSETILLNDPSSSSIIFPSNPSTRFLPSLLPPSVLGPIFIFSREEERKRGRGGGISRIKRAIFEKKKGGVVAVSDGCIVALTSPSRAIWKYSKPCIITWHRKRFFR